MDLKQLEYILKIAEEKNITHAAEKLYLTQSALNQQLLKLEKELGTPLFYRSRIDWRPTPAGEIYLKAAREILSIKQEAYNRIYDLTETQKGHLSIGFTPGRGIPMFSYVYPRFHQAHPEVHIEPIELSVRNQQTMLLAESLDIGFITLPKNRQRAGLQYIPIAREELFLAMPKTLSKIFSVKEDEPFPLILLKEQPFVLTHKTSTIRELTDEIFKAAGFEPDVLFETTNNNTIISMIRAGICCGIVPAYYADRSDPALAFYTIEGNPSWDIYAACKKGHYISKAAREFISLATDYWT